MPHKKSSIKIYKGLKKKNKNFEVNLQNRIVPNYKVRSVHSLFIHQHHHLYRLTLLVLLKT